ncbi:hypothetical protein BS47DRAFT_127908 [Hydnum rufescens UP504]|uniref:Uncharacterized protein n=1 Tax=Hydnum rufescens UP504 TaxID=1448309 RepID=A0A9P6APW0_9AGAM|nr:hypothetical protein BS47DRAFT_127908 [Hydnum rufescens UP504]
MVDQPKEARKPRGIKRPFLQRIAIFFRRFIMDTVSRSSTMSASAVALRQSSDLFKSKHWTPIFDWRERVFKFKDTARSYALIEARLYKNEHNVEHEFILGEFKGDGDAGVFFAATERVTIQKDLDHKVSDEERNRSFKEIKAEHEKQRQDIKKQKLEDKPQRPKISHFKSSPLFHPRQRASRSPSIRSVSSWGERTASADDRIRLILGAQDFNAAVETLTKERPTKTTFILCGSLKYQFDTQPNAASTSVPGDVLPTPLCPDFLNFTSAAHAIHRSRTYYTAGHNNCYWFAMGMMFILSKNFPPSESIVFDAKQGTLRLGVFRIPAGELWEEEENELLEAYTRDMQEMELEKLPRKTEKEIIYEQRKRKLEQQLNEQDRLTIEAEGKLSQVKTKEADAKRRRAESDTKASEAALKAERSGREKEQSSSTDSGSWKRNFKVRSQSMRSDNCFDIINS